MLGSFVGTTLISRRGPSNVLSMSLGHTNCIYLARYVNAIFKLGSRIGFRDTMWTCFAESGMIPITGVGLTTAASSLSTKIIHWSGIHTRLRTFQSHISVPLMAPTVVSTLMMCQKCTVRISCRSATEQPVFLSSTLGFSYRPLDSDHTGSPGYLCRCKTRREFVERHF